MISLIGQSVNLIPDSTVIHQIIIFLIVLSVLTIFVFKPVLRIIEKRRGQTVDLNLQAQKLLSESETMDRRYNENLAVAKMEGSRLERELLRQGEEEGRTIVAKARDEERQAIARKRTEIQAAAQRVRQDLSLQIEEVAQMIIAKVLGRGTKRT